jgi:hypothetical protein
MAKLRERSFRITSKEVSDDQHHHAPISPRKEAEIPRAPPPAEKPVAHPEARSLVVTIEPVLVYGSLPRHRVAAPRSVAKPALVPCSDWRALESGPAGHGVRTLCSH